MGGAHVRELSQVWCHAQQVGFRAVGAISRASRGRRASTRGNDRAMRRAVLLLALLACRNRHREEPKPVPEAKPVAATASGGCTGDAVKTADGCVRGKREGELAVYRGIPYAAPPVGALRWKLPQP